ncbi:MAG: MBL fold metallo-hydrolase [Myxococcota bacterium]
MPAALRFLGGAGTVTGSRFLVTTEHARVLVDCGLFQGRKALRLRNWEPFPVDPASLDAVLLTHAHIDHCGFLPALLRAGFRGRVLATRGTLELARIVLPDSGRLHEEDALHANRGGYSKHAPALPLYTEEDGEATASRIEPLDFGAETEIAPGVRACFSHAGHILGAASITLTLDGPPERRIAISGDLGRSGHPLLRPPEPAPAADWMLVESTYGDRRHDDSEVLDALGAAVAATVGRGGVVVIPAFAVDRTEVVLFHLRALAAAGRIPSVPVFVDSPMALAALRVYRRAVREGWDEVRPELRGREEVLEPGELDEVRDAGESRALCERQGPFVVVSASGMATGGRVLHHLAVRLPDARNSVLLVGYQVPGTRGHRLLSGERAVKMRGRYIPVRAEIRNLSAFSVHADADELVGWVRQAARRPQLVFTVHGEPDAAATLAARIDGELELPAVVPRDGERVQL